MAAIVGGGRRSGFDYFYREMMMGGDLESLVVVKSRKLGALNFGNILRLF